MKIDEYQSHDLLGLAALVKSGEVSGSELLDTALEVTRRVNGDVNAVVRLMEAEARRDLDCANHNSAFYGVPYLLKDLTAMYDGVPTTQGSVFFKDFVPDYDTVTVRRLRDSGLVIFGKTNTPELGGNVSAEPRLFGPTRNPWNTTFSAGGSSGGAAAAVGAGIVPAAHATDGGGSIRIPASCCGLFGLKPSRGRTSFGPKLGEGWNGMTSEHAITRSVRDSAALLDVIAGPARGDPYGIPAPRQPYLDALSERVRPLRIAYTAVAPSGTPVDERVVAALMATVEALRAIGHVCVEAVPELDGPAVSDANVKVIAVHHAFNVGKRAAVLGREPQADDIEKVMQYRVDIGRQVSAVDYVKAVEILHQAGRAVGEFMREYDVMLRPTTAKPPQPIGTFDMNTDDLQSFLKALWEYIPFTALFNATGQPAMSVPLGWADGLPMGMQFAGRYSDEETLFQLARQLEVESPWADRRPSMAV
jgi:Asp-tRNA(Asn)/Glu-tRNA(Gln) amidotransferase A subunit family amidase